MKQKYVCLLALLFATPFLFTQTPETQETALEEEKPKTQEKPARPAKIRPHFVGAPRPKPKQKKPSSKINTQWVISKTHPKPNKKTSSSQESQEEASAELPYLNRTQEHNLVADNSDRIRHSTIDTEEQEIIYPPIGLYTLHQHAYVTGEWLFWRVRQGGMEFAIKGVSTTVPATLDGAVPTKVVFHYQSGFRVGCGVHLPHDGWDIYVNFTDFCPSASKNTEGSLFPLLLYQGPSTVTSAKARWEIDFLNLDIEIGRTYCIGKTLSYRPYVGMKGAWIDQSAHITYTDSSVHTRNDCKGAGPRVGIGSNWALGSGLCFFSNLSTTLLAGHFDLKQKQTVDSVETVDMKSDLNLVNPALELILGLGWDQHFHHNRYRLGLSAGFESQYWWSQNQMERFTNNTSPIYERTDNDLGFYGLTMRARFDF